MAELSFSILQSVCHGITAFSIAWLFLVVIVVAKARFRYALALNYLNPFFAPLKSVITRFWRIAGVLIFILAVANPKIFSDGTAITLPNPGSVEEQWGNSIFGLWFMMYLGSVLQSFGFPPNLPYRSRFHIAWTYQWIALLLGVGLVAWSGSYLLIGAGVIVTSLFYFGLVFYFTRKLALNSRDAAKEISPQKLERLGTGKIHFLHITDSHITNGSPRIEGGEPGNSRFENIKSKLPGKGLPWLFHSGDLTDHGRIEEWELGVKFFHGFKEFHSDVRIILAPGNHDVATAYNTEDALFSLLTAKTFPLSNGVYMRRYLQYASELDEELKTADGKLLCQIISDSLNADAEIIETRNTLYKNAPADSEGFSRLADRANKLYPDVQSSWWNDVLNRSMILKNFKKYYEENIVPEIWRKRWFDYFPLHLANEKSKEAVIILNSNAPDPTIGGGAWGLFGPEQLDRTERILESYTGDRVYLLCHHAPFSWHKSQMGMQEIMEWATTSVLTGEIEKLMNILKNFQSVPGNDLVFLCGHRHGGKSKQSSMGKWENITIIEGASLADEKAELVAGWINKDNKLQIGHI